jgi:hypothetical protein
MSTLTGISPVDGSSHTNSVVPGFDPGTHSATPGMDCRVGPGNDEVVVRGGGRWP